MNNSVTLSRVLDITNRHKLKYYTPNSYNLFTLSAGFALVLANTWAMPNTLSCFQLTCTICLYLVYIIQSGKQVFCLVANIENWSEKFRYHVKLCNLVPLPTLWQKRSLFTCVPCRTSSPLMESSFTSAIVPSLVFQKGISCLSCIEWVLIGLELHWNSWVQQATSVNWKTI